MGYPLRWNRTDLVFEVTIETIQGRYLLRPNREVRDVILGVISRAQEHYQAIRLYAFVFTRNRATLLVSTGDEEQLSKFMAYVDGEISRRLGRLLDWSGKLWGSRYRALPVLDEEAITERLRAVLSQGVDEGLVASPRDWPGASCVPALLGAMKLEGAWVDRDREARLRGLGLDPPASAYVRPYRVVLTPIPAWAALSPTELVARYQAIIESIELEHLVTRAGPVLDPVELQRQDPFTRPERSPRRRLARLCHSTYATLIAGFRVAYRQFCAAFRAAAGALLSPSPAKAALVADFPGGCNPRPDLSVPLPPGEEPAPWWCESPAAHPPARGDEAIVDEAATASSSDPPTSPWVRVVEVRAPRGSSSGPERRTSPASHRAQSRRRGAEQATRALALARPPPRGQYP